MGGGGTTSPNSARAGEKAGEMRSSGSPSSKPSLDSGFANAAVGIGVVRPSEEAISPLRAVLGADSSGSAGPKRRRLSSGVKRVRSTQDEGGCGGEAKKSSGLKPCCAGVDGEGDRPPKPGVGVPLKPGAGRDGAAAGVESVTVEEGGSEKGATPVAGEETMTANGSNGRVPDGLLLGSMAVAGATARARGSVLVAVCEMCTGYCARNLTWGEGGCVCVSGFALAECLSVEAQLSLCFLAWLVLYGG